MECEEPIASDRQPVKQTTGFFAFTNTLRTNEDDLVFHRDSKLTA
jgi:hypothetical protein